MPEGIFAASVGLAASSWNATKIDDEGFFAATVFSILGRSVDPVDATEPRLFFSRSVSGLLNEVELRNVGEMVLLVVGLVNAFAFASAVAFKEGDSLRLLTNPALDVAFDAAIGLGTGVGAREIR